LFAQALQEFDALLATGFWDALPWAWRVRLFAKQTEKPTR
jgi:hypothetical protein